MLSARPTHYLLSPRALDDLDDVWRYTAENRSLDQADTYIDGLVEVFDAIVAMPNIAGERPEFTPPVHIHSYQSHLVVYMTKPDQIVILRVLGGQQNWQEILRALEP
ncbi:type II toxin-antitoxin system RelE/ParE family toxin [Thalassospira alkalitolerans]|uniref:type II toxin-antitoxin system RelE/ParE family toxin n=1 Tax=Thalassospira alkalitolerans TaxID=1293890 RepID=UPI003AA8E9FA